MTSRRAKSSRQPAKATTGTATAAPAAKRAAALPAMSSTAAERIRTKLLRLQEDLDAATGQQIDGEDGRKFIGEASRQLGIPGEGGSLLRAMLHMASGNETRAAGAMVEFVGSIKNHAVRAARRRRRRKAQANKS